MIFEVGPLRLEVDFRSHKGDEGWSIRIFAEGREALRFDVFHKNPHYHLDPDGAKAEKRLLAREAIPIPMRWVLENIKGNLPSMLREAGFSDSADALQSEEVQATLPDIVEALGALDEN